MEKRRHGMSQTAIYDLWVSMKARCNNPKNNGYRWYGARGIKLCRRWHSFMNFYLDMGERPDGKSLDRIDNEKGYSKENCRWATIEEQKSNLRHNRYFYKDGVQYTLNQAKRKFKISTLAYLIDQGLTFEEALSKPKHKQVKKFKASYTGVYRRQKQADR